MEVLFFLLSVFFIGTIKENIVQKDKKKLCINVTLSILCTALLVFTLTRPYTQKTTKIFYTSTFTPQNTSYNMVFNKPVEIVQTTITPGKWSVRSKISFDIIVK